MSLHSWGLTALAAASLAAQATPAAAQDPAPSGTTTTTTTTKSTTTQPADPQPPTGGAGERVGNAADRVGGAIKRGVRGTAETVRESFAGARQSVHAMNVQARVYSRIHWDKTLTEEQEINIDVARDGTVSLRGAVNDAKAKAHAVILARDTVGVNRVVDELTLRSGTTVTPRGTTTTTEEIRVRPAPVPAQVGRPPSR